LRIEDMDKEATHLCSYPRLLLQILEHSAPFCPAQLHRYFML